jgi:hypothetical protein
MRSFFRVKPDMVMVWRNIELRLITSGDELPVVTFDGVKLAE